MNYLYSGMVYILQHSAATDAGWQLEQSFALFVSAHTGQGSREATDFFNWLLSVIGTGCLMFERIQFSLEGTISYTK